MSLKSVPTVAKHSRPSTKDHNKFYSRFCYPYVLFHCEPVNHNWRKDKIKLHLFVTDFVRNISVDPFLHSTAASWSLAVFSFQKFSTNFGES